LDDKGLSTMYDAILFIVMISLSSIILTPIFEMQTINKLAGERYRENVAEETLHTFLVSMPSNFNYNLGGSIVDTAAETLGIDVADNNNLYHTITTLILGREQLHKTYNCIIAENLCSQFMIPISNNDSIKLNIFTEDFNEKLKDKIIKYLLGHLGDYNFNFTAYWYPIKGVGILEDHDIDNITKTSLSENLTALFRGFLLDGLLYNNISYPSILDIFISYGLSNIEDAIENISSKLINTAIGEGLYTLQGILGDIDNTTYYTGLFNILEKEFIDYLTNSTGINFYNLTGIITPLEDIIKPVIWNILEPIVEQLTSYIIDEFSSTSSNSIEILMDLLFNQVSTKATAVLVVWEDYI